MDFPTSENDIEEINGQLEETDVDFEEEVIDIYS
jgi:hypothetical protein